MLQKKLLLTVRGRTESERVGYYLWQCVQCRWNIPDRSVFSAVRILLTIVYSALIGVCVLSAVGIFLIIARSVMFEYS